MPAKAGPGRPPGQPKTGGRKKGTPNFKRNHSFDKALSEFDGLDPEMQLVLTAFERLPCRYCDEHGKVPEETGLLMMGVTGDDRLSAARTGGLEMSCPRCAGTGFKLLEPGEATRALIRIIDSRVPKKGPAPVDTATAGLPILQILGNLADPEARAIFGAFAEIANRKIVSGEAVASDEGGDEDGEP